MNEQICPSCCEDSEGADWPLRIDGKIVVGGCQMCWESQCSESWFAELIAVEKLVHG